MPSRLHGIVPSILQYVKGTFLGGYSLCGLSTMATSSSSLLKGVLRRLFATPFQKQHEISDISKTRRTRKERAL